MCKPIINSEKNIPGSYKCSICGATNCKLWRNSEGQNRSPILLCVACVLISSDKKILCIDADGTHSKDSCSSNRTDRIGFCVPAVPIPNSNRYWGWGLAPSNDYSWWKKLPTLPPEKA